MNYTGEIITSRQNPLVKFLVSLQDKKGRDQARSFFVEGVKLSDEAFSNSLPITHCIISESRISTLLSRYQSLIKESKSDEARIVVVADAVFEKISTEKAPQGVITVIKYLDFFSNMDIIYKEDFFYSSDERAIILSSVRDPSNLGSVIRSAAALGVTHVVVSSDCADVYSPKTVRAAMGSLFHVKLTKVKDLVGFIAACREGGRRVFSAELDEGARRLAKGTLTDRDIVVIGNEGHGVSREVSLACDGAIYIPICSGIESLNASVAAAIFMWEQFN